jgi:hypothetical protein
MREGIRRREIMGFEGYKRRKGFGSWEGEFVWSQLLLTAETGDHSSEIRWCPERQGNGLGIAELIRAFSGLALEAQPGKGAPEINIGIELLLFQYFSQIVPSKVVHNAMLAVLLGAMEAIISDYHNLDLDMQSAGCVRWPPIATAPVAI